MTSTIPIFVFREMNSVRVRVGRLGRPILQIRRTVYRSMCPGLPWERHNAGEWRDAKRADIPDVAVFFEGLDAPLASFSKIKIN